MAVEPFQWDPNSDQVFRGPSDEVLSGPGSTFDKVAGKSFSMLAPFCVLFLQISPDDNNGTVWGDLSSAEPTIINIERGVLWYDARNSNQAH